MMPGAWNLPPRGPNARRPMTVRPGNTRPQPRPRHRPNEADAKIPGRRHPALARLEALLFLADEPLSLHRLADILKASTPEVTLWLEELQQLYQADQSAFDIQPVAGGYRLLTREVFRPWLDRWHQDSGSPRLSSTALETLAVIAYKQPITRAEVERIRGVACGEMIRQLMEKGLVRMAGRENSLGRPQLYATTKRFLAVFGLNSLADLPPCRLAKPRQRLPADATPPPDGPV